jgi:UDP:flavonoid glycosyltransferase YjiC (YdhE family)
VTDGGHTTSDVACEVAVLEAAERDQADNAERLVSLGVARRLDHKHFTIDGATKALRGLLADELASQKAKQFATSVAEEDGAKVAADGIAALLQRANGSTMGNSP